MSKIKSYDFGYNKKTKRTVRSFVNRDGRITLSQKNALTKLLPLYGVRQEELRDLGLLFKNRNPVYLEIGTGNGLNIIKLADSYPGVSFLGCEIYKPGLGRTLMQLDQQKISNLRVILGDAMDVVNSLLEKTLDRVYVFFPDPWPKKRHNKRRLINAQFLEMIGFKMKTNGRLYIATDCAAYAAQIIELIESSPRLDNIAGPKCFAPRPSWRETTRFESRALAEGSRIFEIVACVNLRYNSHKRLE